MVANLICMQNLAHNQLEIPKNQIYCVITINFTYIKTKILFLYKKKATNTSSFFNFITQL